MKELEYTPFKLVPLAAIAAQSGMITSTLRTWSKTKPRAVRLLEYAIYFDIFDSEVMGDLINPALSFLNALKLIGADELTVQDISQSTGIPKRTIHAWWGGSVCKRLLIVTLVKGVVTTLSIAKNQKLYQYWPVSNSEKRLKDKLSSANIDGLLKKAFDLWVGS